MNTDMNKRQTRHVGLLTKAVRVVGVGDAGCRIAAHIAYDVRQVADVICVNTDEISLRRVNNAHRMALGADGPYRFGAGGDSLAGARAALASMPALDELAAGASVLLIVAGLGGGTGSGAAPVIAKAARRAGVFTVGLVSLPFEFEGAARTDQAREALAALSKNCDGVISVRNDDLLVRDEIDTSFDDAFRATDSLFAEAIRAISGTLTAFGSPHIGLSDLRSVLNGGSVAAVGIGEASGQDAARLAVEAAIGSTGRDEQAFRRVKRVAVFTHGGPELSLAQVAIAMGAVRDAASEEAGLLMGVYRDRKHAGKVRVLLIAALAPEREATVVRGDGRHVTLAGRDSTPDWSDEALLPLFN